MRQLDYLTPRHAVTVAREFASWLNGTGGTRPVLRMLDLEQKIRHLEREHFDYVSTLPGDGPESDNTADAMFARLEQLRRTFNRLLSKYRMFPILIDTDPYSDKWTFRWELVDAPNRPLTPAKHMPVKATLDDLDALFAVVRLAQFGYLSRIKQCHCGNWYFERVFLQEFCSGKCRQWAFSKNETFKGKRREYMRRYYKLQRSQNVK